MLKWVYDLLFVRSQWTIIDKVSMVNDGGHILGTKYTLQNQWGNIKHIKNY